MPEKYYIVPAGDGGLTPGHPLPEPPPSVRPPLFPTPPIQLPPVPPGFKPPELPPPSVGGGPIIPEWPIISPPLPGHPLPEPPPVVGGGPIYPDQIWPPLPPDSGLVNGKYLILVYVYGVGSRWLVYDATKPVEPPPATPKNR